MSALAKNQKLTREEYRKAKVLEEQRKAGTVPAEVDPETGRDINPHIPQYIAQAPWYYGIDHATLKHQRKTVDSQEWSTDNISHAQELNHWYRRGEKAGAATTYRPGACTNCGAITHKTKDCVERPRRVGAKWDASRGIEADEVVQDIRLGFEAKRDRWNGYDPREFVQNAAAWELIDQKRRKLREAQVAQDHTRAADAAAATRQTAKRSLEAAAERPATPAGTAAASGSAVPAAPSASTPAPGAPISNSMLLKVLGDAAGDDASHMDEDKYADSADMPGQKLNTNTRMTVRNLRIREDTAKYLINLDPDSAYYDPKTRTMKGNPLEGKVDPVTGEAHTDADFLYGGDNRDRQTGEVPKIAQLTSFAWEAERRGKDVHLQANPTLGELMYRQYDSKKEALSKHQREHVLAKYGGAEHLRPPPAALVMAQSDHYVEYAPTGRVIKGQERATAKSRYEEDVLLFNHTSVWGSWYSPAGQWGYACCHSVLHHAYCTAGVDVPDSGSGSASASASASASLSAPAPASPSTPAPAPPSTAASRSVRTAPAAAAPSADAGASLAATASSAKPARAAAMPAVHRDASHPKDGGRVGPACAADDGAMDADRLQAARAKLRAQRQWQVDATPATASASASTSASSHRKPADGPVITGLAATEEDVEAYRLETRHREDPMAALLRAPGTAGASSSSSKTASGADEDGLLPLP